jgi:hypothetical protein
MRRQSFFAALMVGLSLTASASAGIAITNATGTITYAPSAGLFEGGTRTYTPSIPGGDKLVFLQGQVSQDSVLESNGTFAIDAKTLIDSNVAQPAPDSSSTFEMTFTLDQPMRYHFRAELIDQGPQSFQAKLDDITGSAFYDSQGNGTGTLPFDVDTGTFGAFVNEGTLKPRARAFRRELVDRQLSSRAKRGISE